jgi:DNA-binding HxlR family transcriptional regulator
MIAMAASPEPRTAQTTSVETPRDAAPIESAAPDSARIRMAGSLNPRSGWTITDSCPIARTFEALSTKTAYLLLREAFYGATRFEEFVERTGVSEPVAAARLRELVDEGMLERVPYREPGKRTRQGYRLTAKGVDFQPVLVAMMQWGDRWLFTNGARVQLTHSECGEPVHTVLTCDGGHELSAGDAELTLRPRSGSAAQVSSPGAD